MILDSYFLPILEILISIAVPLILTLKSVEVVLSNELSEQSKYVLLFWLNYWLILSFIELSDINSHFRTIFTLYYLSQHHYIPGYLVRFYRLNLLPFVTKTAKKLVNWNLTENDTDYYLGLLLDRVCFDVNFLNRVVNAFYNKGNGSQPINVVHVSNEGSPKRGMQTAPYPETLDTHNPLEVVKSRGKTKPDAKTRSRSNSSSVNRPKSTSNTPNRIITDPLPKKPSKSNLRGRRSSYASLKSNDDFAPYPHPDGGFISQERSTDQISFQHAEPIKIRDPTDDVFEDQIDLLNIPGDRRSLRSGLKSIFTS